MKLRHYLAGIAVVFLISALISLQMRSTITGRVVDAETAKSKGA